MTVIIGIEVGVVPTGIKLIVDNQAYDLDKEDAIFLRDALDKLIELANNVEEEE